MNWGIKVLQTSALPLGYVASLKWSGKRDSNSRPSPWQGDALPLSYSRKKWCLRTESNRRHGDFQSPALPTELPRQMATRKGLEPSTSAVTGRHSNQLNYRAIFHFCRRVTTYNNLPYIASFVNPFFESFLKSFHIFYSHLALSCLKPCYACICSSCTAASISRLTASSIGKKCSSIFFDKSPISFVSNSVISFGIFKIRNSPKNSSR